MFLIPNSALPNTGKYAKNGSSASPAIRKTRYMPGDVQSLQMFSQKFVIPVKAGIQGL